MCIADYFLCSVARGSKNEQAAVEFRAKRTHADGHADTDVTIGECDRVGRVVFTAAQRAKAVRWPALCRHYYRC